MSRQPPAARPAACGQSARGAPAGPLTASTSAAARTSGRWLIAATAASCSAASIATGRAWQARASVATTSASPSRAPAPGTITHGRSTNRVAEDAA